MTSAGQECRFFVSYTGVKLPLRLVTAIAPEQLSNRNTFIRGYFDAAGALTGFEKLVYGEMTTGAENDIERATHIARKMVTECGMSDRVGPVALGHKEELIFLGREIGEQKNYSEKVAEVIDDEVRRLIETAYSRATSILSDHRSSLDLVARTLVQEETIEADQFEKMLLGAVVGGELWGPPPELAPEPSNA